MEHCSTGSCFLPAFVATLGLLSASVSTACHDFDTTSGDTPLPEAGKTGKPDPGDAAPGDTRPMDARADVSSDTGVIPSLRDGGADASGIHSDRDEPGREGGGALVDASEKDADSASGKEAGDDTGFTDFVYTDQTGRMTIDIRICAPSAAGPAPAAVCEPPPEFLLVGGGAEVMNSPTDSSSGAALTANAPANGCDSWSARSVEMQPGSFIHQVRAYAIGLRLSSRSAPGTFISRATLSQARHCDGYQTPYGVGGASSKVAPDGFTLVGGGVSTEVHYGDASPARWPGIVLFRSISSSGGWTGFGDALGPEAESGVYHTAVISLREDIDDFGKISTSVGQATLQCQAGGSCTLRNLLSDDSGVITSIEGSAESGVAARYLTTMKPVVDVDGHGQLSPGLTLSSKNFAAGAPQNDPLAANQGWFTILHASE